jgi:hypothetical protein
VKLDPDKPIAGQSPRVLREFCQVFYYNLFSRESVSGFFGKDITTRLRKARIIKPSSEVSGYYVLAAFGSRLGQHSFKPRIRRATAERLVAAMLVRAEAINADPDLLYWIDAIHAFGSFIKDTPDLGDVDLIVDWARRPLPEGMRGYSDWCRARAEACGKDDYRYGDWGLIEVCRRLQAKSSYLSLKGPEQHEKLRKSDPVKIIYSRSSHAI